VRRPAEYPSEFRREAIALVKSSGRPVAEVARSQSIAGAAVSVRTGADAARTAQPIRPLRYPELKARWLIDQQKNEAAKVIVELAMREDQPLAAELRRRSSARLRWALCWMGFAPAGVPRAR
jgi:transposase-like protein